MFLENRRRATVAALAFASLGFLSFRASADLLQTGKVIYGNDDRIDVYAETDPERLDWAASTVALVSASRLTDNGDGTFTLGTVPFSVLGRQPCESEPFGTQPTSAFCSGFLAGDDVIATAGHCVNAGNLPNVRFVFGFVMSDAENAVTLLNANQVYSGTSLLGQANQGDLDYAVVKLDRVVTAPNACALPIRREGVVSLGAQVGVIGHPSGLPMKIAFGAQTVVKSNDNASYFMANLDTYGGNSGSPVFNAATGLVEGVLVRGERDYNVSGSCFVSNVLSDSAAGEDISKSTSFAAFVPDTQPACAQVETAHSGDLNRDGSLGLSELLRIIQLYNAGEFHCDATVEDGYALGTGDQTCEPHASDYLEVNFAISLSELLRGVQIYNAGTYTACESGEDGFCI